MVPTKRRARRTLWAAAAVVAGAAGLVGAPGPVAGAAPAVPDAPAQAGSSSAAWTVLIYGDLDNDLEEDTLRNMLTPAANLPSHPDVNVIAVIDRIQGFDEGPMGSIPNAGDAHLVRMGDGDYESLMALGEIDMGDPQTLAWLVQTGITQFPAERYAVFLSDHGGGYLGVTWDDSTPSDDPLGSHLSVDEIGAGLKAGLAGTGVDKIDLVGFDTCLTATVEVAATLAPHADYLLASEEIATGLTTNYAALVRLLQAEPDSDAEDAGRLMVNQPGVTEIPSGTFSLVDLSRIGTLQQAIRSLAAVLTENLEEVATEVGRQRAQSLEFGGETVGGPGGYGAVDLGDLLARLSSVPPEVDTARQAAHQALLSAVVDLQNGPAATQATGLTIYFPNNLQEYRPQVYNEIDVARPWARFLAAYFGVEGPGDDPVSDTDPPEFDSPAANVVVDPAGVLVTADLVAGRETGVVDARFFGGEVLPDSSVAHLMLYPAVIGAGNPLTIAAGWDFGHLQITDGTVALDATTVLTPVVDGLLAQVPLLYQDPVGQQVQAAMQFTLDAQGVLTGEIVLVSYADTGAVARLVPEPGSLLAPLVLVSQPAGESSFVLLGNRAVDGPSVSLALTSLAPGSTYHVALTAADATGRTAFASATGVV